jgi:ABC-type protease/lipase transport system fused ATPase/permease subunit
MTQLLEERPPQPVRLSLPRPHGPVAVENLMHVIPGSTRPVLNAVTFALQAGEILAVVGPTAAGKSTLARMLVGVWRPAAGTVRLDGAEVSLWNREEFGRYVGYLPQDIELFAGTVTENIARFGEVVDEDVLAAARLAGAHEMILGLPQGYETQVGDGGAYLSGGQRQRVALARAVFGRPSLVVLDEPNSNLDREGEAALAACLKRLKESGTTVIIISHRISAFGHVDKVLHMREGRIEAFGPRDQVLATLVQTLRIPTAQPATMRAQES